MPFRHGGLMMSTCEGTNGNIKMTEGQSWGGDTLNLRIYTNKAYINALIYKYKV